MCVQPSRNFRSNASRLSPAAARLALAALIAPAFPSLAHAQQQQGRRVDLNASTRLQYDSNVVLSDTTVAGGRPQSDFSVAPSVNADIYLPRAGGSFYLTGGIGYNFYRRYTRLNRESINLTGGADQRLASCVVHGEGTYSRRLSDLGDLLQESPAESFNNTEERRGISADVGCGGTIGLRPSVAVSRIETRNTSTLRKFADSNTTSFTGQLGYVSPAIGTISLFGRYSDSSYINRATPNGEQDGVRTYAAGLQLERNLGTRLNLAASVNYTKVDPKLAQTAEFTGVGYDLSATYSGDLFQLTISGSRVAQPSQLQFVSYDIQTTIGAVITRQLSPRISLTGGARYSRRRFAPSEIFTGAPPPGNDERVSLNTGLRYRAGPRLNFMLDASYQRRTSNIQLFAYNTTRVGLTTSLSF
ncbi:outer membrane beta-barrel protein [Sphingomonas sp. RS6]